MKRKTILFFVSLDRSCFDEQLDGIFRHPHAQNWHEQVVELTVGGVLQPHGDYTYGSGTLHVSHPFGFIMSVQ